MILPTLQVVEELIIMYIFYGVEIPKTWSEWPSAFGNSPRTITSGSWEVDVPNIGGEPVLYKNKTVNVEGFQLTLFRYPHNQEDNPYQENLGILGFLVCEFCSFDDPTQNFKRYQYWQEQHNSITNFDTTIRDVCGVLDFNYIQPILLSCDSTCPCC